MSPPPKTIEQRLADLEERERRLEETDRRHSKQVRAVREGVDETKRAVTDHGGTSRDELLGAVRILSSAIGDMAIQNEQRRAEDIRAREALEREVRALTPALSPVVRASANAELAATRSKAVSAAVAQDTGDILERQQADRKVAWGRLAITLLSLPILQQALGWLLRHF